MVGKVWQSGNSKVITLSKDLMILAGLEVGTKVKVSLNEKGMIEIEKVEWEKEKKSKVYGGVKNGKKK